MTVLTKRTWYQQDVPHEALLGMARHLGPERRLPTVPERCSSLRVRTATLNPVRQQLESESAIGRAAFDRLDFLMTGRRPASQPVAVQPTVRQPNV